jgi:hypothetical protein
MEFTKYREVNGITYKDEYYQVGWGTNGEKLYRVESTGYTIDKGIICRDVRQAFEDGTTYQSRYYKNLANGQSQSY